ncbi:hypothetical protein AVEN_237607-1 [Araneus ventricosus]|uniref:Uncharacterized protein n=1 Tax=Araneus ventricosus TaxID=182803 RepID=A0A4Y2R3L8_ARAVE|nr:hypothetical protein AVEN_237607-1 [Araneus ventricosus]
MRPKAVLLDNGTGYQKPGLSEAHAQKISSKCTLRVEGKGSVHCRERFRRTRCDIQCDGKYQGLYICTPHYGWNTELPYCVREVEESKANTCTLYIEGNGSVNCTGDDHRNVCDIECDGKYQGAFICTPENGWSSKLPYCAREVTKGELYKAGFGCPDNADKCIEFCRNSFRSNGHCIEDETGKKTLCACNQPSRG